MGAIFRGDGAKIRKYVARADARGQWRELKYGCNQYRTDDGAILNWWQKSGKITFQGDGDAAAKFEQAFKALALRADRLTDGNGRTLEGLGKENETLRALIADVLLKNALLRKRLKKKRSRSQVDAAS